MDKKIAVLGAGNAGHAAAFEISLNGGEVMLFEHPNYAKSLDGIRQKGGIEEVLSGFTKIANLTTDAKAAMDFSDIVLLMVPEFAHEAIFKMVMPYLRDGHLIVTQSGNFASLFFKKWTKEAGINKKVTFVDTTTIPYAVRVIAPGTIYIEGKKSAYSAGALPAKDKKE